MSTATTHVRLHPAACLVVYSAAIMMLGVLQVHAAEIALPGHMAHKAQIAHPVGTMDPSSTIELSLVLGLRNEAQLDALIIDLYNPKSAQYGRYLTGAEFLRKFGPTKADYDRVIAFAKSHHFVVTRTTGSRAFVHVRAKTSDVQKAFRVELHTYTDPVNGKIARAPLQEPRIDNSLPIIGVYGLNTFAPPQSFIASHPLPHLSPTAHTPKADAPNGPFGGSDFRAAYAPDVSLTGAGQVVGILELQDFLDTDIQLYEKNEGLPNVPINRIKINGGAPAQPNDCDGLDYESPMDVEQVIAMAPGLKQVTVYEINRNQEVGVAGVELLDEVLNPSVKEPIPNQVTTSWSISYDTPRLYPLLKEMVARRIGFFAYSGDNGALDADTLPWPPNDDPNVTSVGATVLTTDTAGNWSSEVAATFSGGGTSPWGPKDPEFNIPAYQKGLNWAQIGGSSTVRNTPDVAAVGQSIRVVCRGQTIEGDGTSASTPLWAAFEALANQQGAAEGKSPIGNINSSIYAIGTSSKYATTFHDITSGSNAHTGSNGNYSALTGYDLVTGWGSPRGMATINALVANLPALPSNNCANLAELIKSLQQQLTNAENALHTARCEGPASFECEQAVKTIQMELSDNERLYQQTCGR
jgi:subtilase family serine protease